MLPRRVGPILGFLALACAVTWPLPTHLTTHLTGPPAGDTGVYVWNLWIFRHEIIRHGHWPFTTDHIFALTNGADLSAHNYTVFANLLGWPFIRILGIVGAFNLTYLLLIALSGYATFLLIRRLTGGQIEAWIAGAVFAASPVLVAKGTGHFSLVAAAPLPIFILCLLRVLRTGRLRDAAIVGAVVGWAGYCDVYYPIYCAMMGALIVGEHHLRITRAGAPSPAGPAIRLVTALLAFFALTLAWRLWHGPAPVTVFGQVIGLRTLYTPVLLLTMLVVVRAQLQWRLRLTPQPTSLSLVRLAGLTSVAVTTAAVVLAPVLVALGLRIVNGRFPTTPIYWRSSPPGLDLVALVLPNPNHPWFGETGRQWIEAAGPLAFPEQVGSLSLVALAIVAFAAWRVRDCVPRFWSAFASVFAMLSLGPFIHVGRVNTYIPGPWALLRYVPGIDLARSPSRFVIVAALGLSVLLGFALVALRRNGSHHGRIAFAAVVALLALELVPAPRPLFSATAPAVYAVIAQNADESLRVLELPGGVRDGTSSLGDFNASAQFYQTVHRKPLVGGYLSRVSEQRKAANLNVPVLATLFTLSERGAVSEELLAQAYATSRAFIDQACIGYVVIDRRRASPELRAFAVDLFNLEEVASDDERQLYRPMTTASGSPCQAGPGFLPLSKRE